MDATVEIWQEYDCPESGIDFDLWDGDVRFVGQSAYCSGCGKTHEAGAGMVIDTTYVKVGEAMLCFGVPRDRAELDDWIEKARQSAAIEAAP